MRVTLLLADSAQAVNGKLYILGGGWSVMGHPVGPSALAMKIDVPWDQSNLRHTVHIELLDNDGNAVPNDEGDPLEIGFEFEVGRPPGVKPGTDLDTTFAFNFPPFSNLQPNTGYEWRVTIDDKHGPDWRAPFYVRSAVPPFGLPGP
jgi:hypothetical protein